jgi:trimethylamine:corrinoid methyltransferase-like protein
MILDNELLSALKQFTKSFEISEESINLETIFEAGPGGGFIDKMHTAQYFRTELWQPEIWSRTMLGPWQAAGGKLDVDLAREYALDIQENMISYQGLDTEMERDILALIDKAKQDLGAK